MSLQQMNDPIRFFNYEAFLEDNKDIIGLINSKSYRDVNEYVNISGIDEIKKGARKFHPYFQKYNESAYLEAFPDVKAAVARGEFVSGFSHFCLFGYREIIEYKRIWPMHKIEKRHRIRSVIAVIGLPRSGLTLLEALLGSHSSIAPWFLPYSTRKDKGIIPFIDSDSIQKQYQDTFAGERIGNETIVISESTSSVNNMKFITESFQNLEKSGIQTKIIWIIRDTNITYLSQREASSKYWGASDKNVNYESYSQYIDFARDGYMQIINLLQSREHLFITYHNLVSDTDNTLAKIYRFINVAAEKNSLYDQNIDRNKIAGDPGFMEYSSILSNRDFERKQEWYRYKTLENQLDDSSLLFVNEFRALVADVNDNTVSNINEYISKLIKRYFDRKYYLDTYDDIKKAMIDPLEHYLKMGWMESRNPNKLFDAKWYKEKEKIVDNNDNPWIHYLLKGRFADIRGKYYEDYYPDIAESLVLIDPKTYIITDNLLLEAPKFEHPKVSIIIPVFNQQNYTLSCIESILRNTEHVSYEIIVMDDCSSDQNAKEIGKHMKNIHFHSNSENLGFLRNCNKGVSLSRGTYLMLLNNDTNVQPGWLESLVDLIESSDKIGIVGSKLIYPSGKLQDAGSMVWSDASGWNYGRLDHPNKPEYNYVRETDYLTGAAMMVRKTLWNEIGGFDELYAPAYYEDPDFAFEARKAGYRVMYQPKSTVVHFEGVTNGTDLGSGVKQYQVINRKKFYKKWKKELDKNQFYSGQNIFLARDRSRKKRHMLFVDHYIPHPDQDAGSKATLDYLRIFMKNNIQVHFIGDNFYDYPGTLYLEKLTQIGIEVLYGKWYEKHWQKWFFDNSKYFDYVLLSRPHIAEKYIDIIKESSSAKIIYFGHDLHFLRERREYEVKGDEIYLQSSFEWLKRELDLSIKADVLCFFSDVEKKELLKLNPFASIDVVPLYIYDHFKYRKRQSKDRKDILFVGGFSHTPNIDAIIWFVNNIWRYIEKEIADIKLYIIGSNPTQEILALSQKSIVVTGYIDDITLKRYYEECKIAVAPLRYGAGIKGKVVDALYNGMPLVTTSIGAEGLPHAKSVMTIRDEAEDFAKSVVSIYLNNDLADSISKRAVDYCKYYFSEEYAVKSMESIFHHLGKTV